MRSNLQLKAWILLILFLSELFSPTHLMSLGSGPSQPEMAAFTPAGTTEMVDPFTGDFTYNIPLMDVEGYPLNIAYNSGVAMEQEASWVGLGWNLNIGTVSRSVRGLPDDFKGENITTKTSMKPMTITKFGIEASAELVGSETLKKLLSASNKVSFIHNNYKGFGISYSNGVGTSMEKGGLKVNAKIGLTLNSLDGTSINSSLGATLSKSTEESGSFSFGGNLGSGYNTRTGQSQLSLGTVAGYEGSGKVSKKDSEGTVTTEEKPYGLSSPSASATFLPIGMNTYTPYPSLQLKTTTFDFSGSIGGEAFGVNPNGKIFGSQTKQELIKDVTQTPAFGYLYSEAASPSGLKDFNRDKSVSLNKTTTHLSPTNFTYDVYSVKGQGVSGMFRPFRNDIGILHDPAISYQSSNSNSIGAELGLGAYVHGGVNYNTVEVQDSYGPWEEGNASSNQFRFQSNEVNSIYENVYFKAAGDKTQNDIKHFNAIGGYDALAFQLRGKKVGFDLKSNTGSHYSLLAEKDKSQRVPRSKVFSFLTAKDAENNAFDKIKSTSGSFYQGSLSVQELPRVDQHRKAHHISEITQINPDGERFVFGTPAYNLSKKEVTFTTSKQHSVGSHGKIPFNHKEASTNNESGIDGYYSSSVTPAYAHSYLLTAKLSPDYKDITGDGVSPDDKGNGYKFNYQKTSSNYKWRTPYEKEQVNFMEGFKSNSLDQKGSYSYGVKEMWYMNSVESKNQIAEFYISEREDAVGVKNERGGLPSSISASDRSFKLDSIVLFNKMDRLVNTTAAIPIKKVEFRYDYSLCKGAENNSSTVVSDTTQGKLTLKKIIVTNKRSKLGEQSPYSFSYSDVNPNYDSDKIDRWGNYKPWSYNPDDMTNADFPYTLQDQDSLMNVWANAWSMTKINTPSGGEIAIEYESDDYGYVQNRRAMQMYPIIGAGNSTTFSSSTSLYNNDFLFIRRPDNIANDVDDAYIKKVLLGQSGSIDNMYFKFFTSIGSGKKEYAAGYVNAINAGYANGNTDYLYVRIADGSPNAISESAWGYFRQNLFEVLYKQPNVRNTGIESIVRGLVANIADIAQMFVGVENFLKTRNIANEFEEKRSFVRLNSSEYFKKGGGSRVKRIVLNDSWNDMVSEGENSTYGQEYEYTTELDGDTISSGVASYEPMIGNDENPFREPVPFVAAASSGHIPAIKDYQERPFGESFLPSASVGYSKVTVKNIHYKKGKTSNSFTEHNFYTAKDFPAIIRELKIQKHDNPDDRASFDFPFSNATRHSIFSASQGYSILLNDMHGKPKSTITYGFVDVIDGGYTTKVRKDFGGTRYNYHHTKVPEGLMLSNEVEVLTKDGYVKDQLLGVEYDLAIDSRRSYVKNVSTSRQVNGDVIPGLFAGVPFPLPSGYSNRLTDIKESRSIVVTKVIQQYGLIESVETFTDQYAVEAFNRMYDGRTGEVLLTETKDEHQKNEFQYSIPSYSVKGQQRMGAAYENIGFQTAITIEPDSLCNLNADSYRSEGYLKHGDKVRVDRKVGNGELEYVATAWVDKNYRDYEAQNCNSYGRLETTWESFNGPFHCGAGCADFVDNCSTYKGSSGDIQQEAWIFPLKKELREKYDAVWPSLQKRSTLKKIHPSNFFYHGQRQTENRLNVLNTKDKYCESNWGKELKYFLSQFGTYNGKQTIFNNNTDLFCEIDDINAMQVSNMFDLTDTIYANVESIHVKDTVANVNYKESYQACVDFEQTYGAYTDHLNLANGFTFFAKGAAPYGDNYKGSRTSFRVKQDLEHDDFLKTEQLFLVKYKVYRTSLQGFDYTYFIERGVGFKKDQFPQDYNIEACQYDYQPNSYSVWDDLPTYNAALQDSLTSLCSKTYKIIDDEGNYIDSLNENYVLTVLQSGNQNKLSTHTGKIISAKYPIDIGNNDRYTGVKAASDNLKIYQATSQLFTENCVESSPFPNTKNKFINNDEGNFRLDSNFKYVSSRHQKSTSSIESSQDGYMETLPNMWLREICQASSGQPVYTYTGGSSSGWQMVEDMERYNQNGTAVESKNNLGNYSSMHTNYKGEVEAVVSNSKQHNFATDGFENYYQFGTFQAELPESNFKFINTAGKDSTSYLLYTLQPIYRMITYPSLKRLVYGVAHTGDYSLFLRGENNTGMSDVTIPYLEKNLNPVESHAIGNPLAVDNYIPFIGTYAPLKSYHKNEFLSTLEYPESILSINEIESGGSNSESFSFSTSNGKFDPDYGKYVISIWVKDMVAPGTRYAGASPELQITNHLGTNSFKASGPLIDGWQKIEANFDYIQGHPVTVTLLGGYWGAFFDDFRIHRFESNLKAFVYDRYSGRLKATLDENNYATYFLYDTEGVPAQLKRETDIGRMTISESRQSLSKNH